MKHRIAVLSFALLCMVCLLHSISNAPSLFKPALSSAADDSAYLFQNVQENLLMENGEKPVSIGKIYDTKVVVPGKVFGAATGNGVILWDYITGKPITWLERFKEIASFAVDIDQRLVITGCTDGTVHFINLADGKILNTLENSTSFNLGLDYSPKLNLLITINGINSLTVWDAKTLQPVKSLAVRYPLKNAFFSKDGTLLFIMNWADTQIIRTDNFETVMLLPSTHSILEYPLPSEKIPFPFFRDTGSLIFCGLSSLSPQASLTDYINLFLGRDVQNADNIINLRLSPDANYLLHTANNRVLNPNGNGSLAVFDIRNITALNRGDSIQPYILLDGLVADFMDSVQIVVLNETNFLRYNLNEKKAGGEIYSYHSGKMNDFDCIAENRFVQANTSIANSQITILDSVNSSKLIYPSTLDISRLRMINDHEMLAFDQRKLVKINLNTNTSDLIQDASPAKMLSFDINRKMNSLIWTLPDGSLSERDLTTK